MPKEQYELKGLIGKGGMATVYFAVSKITGKEYAFKVPEGENAKAEIQKEAYLLEKIRSRRVPRSIGCMDIEGKYGLLMQYRRGNNLEAYLKEHSQMLPDDVLRLGLSLCQVLGYMHRREPPVYFLDLKPANILLRGKRFCALVDFGCAQEADKAGKIYSEGKGTIAYAAPEQFHRGELLSVRTDIYGLGKVLLEALGKERQGTEVEKILQSCVRANMEERPASVGELKLHLWRCYFRRKQKSLVMALGVICCLLGWGCYKVQIRSPSKLEENVIQNTEKLGEKVLASIKEQKNNEEINRLIKEFLNVLYKEDKQASKEADVYLPEIKKYLRNQKGHQAEELLKILETIERIMNE